MAPVLKTRELVGLCERYGVRRLELFGSAVGERFDPQRSDLDFLVTFQPVAGLGLAEQYFGLKDELERLFSRPVDLVELDAVDNPYFLEAIQTERQLLYAA